MDAQGPRSRLLRPRQGRDDSSPSWQVEEALLQEADDRRPQWIIGCDEVGRGCLAGPVMVGACLFRAEDIPLLPIPAGLKDSKLLTPKKRESLLDPLRAWAAGTAVGSCDNRGIDSYGIMEALGAAAIQAIDQAVFGLIGAGDRVAVILDGPYDYISPAFRSLLAPQARIDPDDMTVTTVVKGDRRCACVAGASVIAKVTRDRYMVDVADRHPEWEAYAWRKNKGYGSAEHREAIKEQGPSPYHRLSWHLV